MDSHVPSNPAILLPLINYQRFGHLSLCQTKNLTFSTSLRLHQLKNSGSNSESNHAVKPSPPAVYSSFQLASMFSKVVGLSVLFSSLVVVDV